MGSEMCIRDSLLTGKNGFSLFSHSITERIYLGQQVLFDFYLPDLISHKFIMSVVVLLKPKTELIAHELK